MTAVVLLLATAMWSNDHKASAHGYNNTTKANLR